MAAALPPLSLSVHVYDDQFLSDRMHYLHTLQGANMGTLDSDLFRYPAVMHYIGTRFMCTAER